MSSLDAVASLETVVGCCCKLLDFHLLRSMSQVSAPICFHWLQDMEERDQPGIFAYFFAGGIFPLVLNS